MDTISIKDAPMERKSAPTTIDPRRRVYVPIEKRMLDGNWRFRTEDKTRYTRDQHTGTIRRADPKPLSKKDRRRARANNH